MTNKLDPNERLALYEELYSLALEMNEKAQKPISEWGGFLLQEGRTFQAHVLKLQILPEDTNFEVTIGGPSISEVINNTSRLANLIENGNRAKLGWMINMSDAIKSMSRTLTKANVPVQNHKF